MARLHRSENSCISSLALYQLVDTSDGAWEVFPAEAPAVTELTDGHPAQIAPASVQASNGESITQTSIPIGKQLPKTLMPVLASALDCFVQSLAVKISGIDQQRTWLQKRTCIPSYMYHVSPLQLPGQSVEFSLDSLAVGVVTLEHPSTPPTDIRAMKALGLTP
ncbi:hypothetical protein EG328_002956 [Venturia inaequalis]|uniref:Uncharacterized protein n=1 Tax=Venturia inaequalis TaxID=5025 RepID=A0A8H3UV13_VENIN|nr:hypothetical protein EG328_002956 [Venturia inaequalis]